MISDTEARRIASEWHGGGGTALYAFSSTGAINTARADHDIAAEIAECEPDNGHDRDELWHLSVYLESAGERGPVDGWSNLTW